MATGVAVADMEVVEVEAMLSGNGGAKKINAFAGDQREIRRLSVVPQLTSSTHSSFADIDLAELSLLEVLTQAATDALGSIPAQRCIVYIYDKAANLLRPQVVVDCNDTDTESEVTPIESINEAPDPADEVNSITRVTDRMADKVLKAPLVSFPPVVGMVSSCFLQRRCLRMQEPSPHRTFHREYDVPKDMHVDSILCAPVILYHRATGVIQLINRVDLTAERSLFEEIERTATPQDPRDESSSEVRLRRLKTIKAMVKTGFSTKDEQKLLHFTTHVAQTIEMTTKKLENGRSHAKLREDKAKQALDLLKALNGQIVARVSTTEMLMASDITKHTGRNVYVRRETITRMPSQKGELSDMLGALVVLTRLQAMFRGRRQRRAEKFAEELEKFRKQRERLRTMIVMQRIVPTPEEAKAKVHRKPQENKPTISVSRQASRKRTEVPTKPAQSPTKMRLTTPSPRQTPPQPRRPPTEPTRVQRRKMSAVKIQTVFRRHRQRRQPPTPLPAQPVVHEKLSKKVSSAVKVQSFIRGNLARKRLRRALPSSQRAHIICLRVASSPNEAASNQTSHESPRSRQLRSNTCVYAMPERPGKVPLMQRRSSSPRFSQEERFDLHQSQEVPESRDQNVIVESRRLVAIHKAGDAFRFVKSPVRTPKPRWNRLTSPLIWETSPLEQAPPGVEFVKHRQPIDYQSEKASTPRAVTVPEQNALGNLNTRLPTLGTQTRRDAGKSSLLCCLLPAQTKTSCIASIPARPLAQMRRKAFEAKQRQTPSNVNDAAAGDAVA